jgi:hypothetical protein
LLSTGRPGISFPSAGLPWLPFSLDTAGMQFRSSRAQCCSILPQYCNNHLGSFGTPEEAARSGVHCPCSTASTSTLTLYRIAFLNCLFTNGRAAMCPVCLYVHFIKKSGNGVAVGDTVQTVSLDVFTIQYVWNPQQCRAIFDINAYPGRRVKIWGNMEQY